MTAQVVFDGRLLRARMATEQWLQRTTGEDESKQVEWSTTYSLAGHIGDIRQPNREVSFAAKTKEAGMIALPLPRVRFTSKERNVFIGSGENSTHTPSFSGIPLRHIRDLPRLLPQNRKDVTGGIPSPAWSPEAAAEFAGRGEVLFPAESKSIDFFLNFYRDLDVSAVFDLCVLARVLPQLQHCSWASNMIAFA